MHPYATNLVERQALPLFVAAAAFLSGWAISALVSPYYSSIPFWISVPSVVGLYKLGMELLKYRIWKQDWFQHLGWSKTPVIGGEWRGVIKTSFDRHAAEHPVELTIHQSWSDIAVILRGAHSRSTSVIGGLTVNHESIFTYEYVNEPVSGAVETMHTHRGTARLRVCEGGRVLEGEYYSGRDRTNQGTMRLEKQATPSSF